MTLFFDDHKITSKTSKFCKKRDLDRLFIAIDSATGRYWRERIKRGGITIEAQHRLENKGVISRVEFLAALVHVAILKYCDNGEMNDVSEALHRLLAQHLAPRVDPRISADPSIFRHKWCYARETCDVLASFEPSLRSIFAGVAGSLAGRSGAGAKLISLDEWIDFLRALDFIATDLSERDARFSFVWSRMCVIDSRTERGYMRDSCLPFEGFLEAIVRLSCLKALPTDSEIRSAGCGHAGSFVAKLKLEDEERYEAWLLQRATPLTQTLGDDFIPQQPIERCVAHTAAMLIHTMEVDTAGSDNLRLTQKEAVQWLKMHDLFGYYDDCDSAHTH